MWKSKNGYCNVRCPGDTATMCGKSDTGTIWTNVYSIYKTAGAMNADPCSQYPLQLKQIPNPEDPTCKTYIECVNGVSGQPRTCGNNLLFNPETNGGICDHSSNVKCETNTITTTSTANAATKVTSTDENPCEQYADDKLSIADPGDNTCKSKISL